MKGFDTGRIPKGLLRICSLLLFKSTPILLHAILPLGAIKADRQNAFACDRNQLFVRCFARLTGARPTAK